MSVTRKNLRVCEVLYNSRYYDVLIAVDTLDEVDNILQDWALDKWGVELDLPEALVYNKDITEVLTSVSIDNFAYIQSAVSAYMDMPRFAGISGDLPTFPTALDDDDLYLMPECSAFLYSQALFKGYFGEYTVPEKQLALTEGANFIAIRFNAGVPEYIKYDDDLTIDYSSIIPVAFVLLYTSTLYVIPYGQTGYGLPEKLFQKHLEAKIIGAFTLDTDTNYVELGAVTVQKGTQLTSCLAVDTSAANNDMFLYYKDNAGDWQKSAITTINNTQFQGTGLESLAGGKFVANYIYRLIHGTAKMLFIVLSGSFDTLAAAKEGDMVSDLPDIITGSAVLVGRAIVEKDSTSPAVQKIQTVSWGTV